MDCLPPPGSAASARSGQYSRHALESHRKGGEARHNPFDLDLRLDAYHLLQVLQAAAGALERRSAAVLFLFHDVPLGAAGLAKGPGSGPT